MENALGQGEPASLAGGGEKAGAVPEQESLCWRCGWVTFGLCGWPNHPLPGVKAKKVQVDGERLLIVTDCPYWDEEEAGDAIQEPR